MQPNELATLLPHTRAWLAQASGQLPSFQPISLQVASEQVRTFLHFLLAARASAPWYLSRERVPSASQIRRTVGPFQRLNLSAEYPLLQVGAPATMRTGRVLQESAGSTSSQTETSSPAATPVRDIHGAQAWRGSVRIGLVSLVAAEEPITGQPSRLPETLELDGGQLPPRSCFAVHSYDNYQSNSSWLFELNKLSEMRRPTSRSEGSLPTAHSTLRMPAHRSADCCRQTRAASRRLRAQDAA